MPTNGFPFITNNPNGFKLTITQTAGNSSLGVNNVQPLANVTNPKSLYQPSANGYSQIPTNPKYTPFTNYAPEIKRALPPQTVNVPAQSVSDFPVVKNTPSVKNAIGLVGELVGGTVGRTVGRNLGGDLGAGYGEALGAGIATGGSVTLATGVPVAGAVAGLIAGVGSLAGSALDALGSAITANKALGKAEDTLERANERYEQALAQKQRRDADESRINNNAASRVPIPPSIARAYAGENALAEGWNRIYFTANTPNGFGFPEDGSIRYNPNTTFAWQAGYSPSETVGFGANDLQAIKSSIKLTINGVTGVREGADGSEVFAVQWYFKANGFTAKKYPSDPTVVQPPFPANPEYPPRESNANDWFYGSPMVTVGGAATFPTTDKPYAEPEPPAPFNVKPAPSSNPSNSEPDKKITPSPSGFPQIQTPNESDPYDTTVNGVRTVKAKPIGIPVTTYATDGGQGVIPNMNKPSFTAKPFVSGVSNPSELSNPVDVNTGLTRDEMEKQYTDKQQAFQDSAKANERAAAAYDAKVIEDQLKNLSTTPRSDLGGKSPQQVQRENYQASIKGNSIREYAYKMASGNSTATQNTTPNTPVSNGNNILPTVAGLAGIAATLTAVKIGSDLLVNNSLANTPKINNINANTTAQAQQTNAKQGVCDAMQPQQCGFEGVKAATAEATTPIKEGVTANASLLAQILAAIANLASTIANLFSNLGKVTDAILNNQFVTHAMNYITMISAVHNAAMLSRGLLDTLGSALDSGLQIFGLQLKDKDNNQIGISQAIGTSFQNMIKGIIGNDNWTALNATWVNANRTYQAGINLLSNVQSIIDSTAAVAELTNNRLGTFMNAVRNAGGVRENAYGAQSENVTRFNAYLERMQNLEQGVSNLASITGNIVSVQQSVTELKTNRTEFENALKDKPQGTGLPENTPEKEAAATKKAASIYTISDFSIVKAPEVP